MPEQKRWPEKNAKAAGKVVATNVLKIAVKNTLRIVESSVENAMTFIWSLTGLIVAFVKRKWIIPIILWCVPNVVHLLAAIVALQSICVIFAACGASLALRKGQRII